MPMSLAAMPAERTTAAQSQNDGFPRHFSKNKCSAVIKKKALVQSITCIFISGAARPPNYYTRLQGQLKGNVTPKLNITVLVRFFRPLLDLPDVRLAVLYEYRSVGTGLSGQVWSDNSIPVLAGKQR